MPLKQPTFAPNTPRKLITTWKQTGRSYHKLSQALGVNVKYIYDLMKHGEEPDNRYKTLRAALFLPRYRHKPKSERRQKPPPEPYRFWWNHLDKSERAEFIQILYKEKYNDHPR